MTTLYYFILFGFFQLAITTTAFAITPSQRAAINIWLEQQQDINPRPLKIISNLKNKAKSHNIKINVYHINLNNVKINASTKHKSNISKFKRILDTTFMFDNITIKNTKYRNKKYYFNLHLKKANLDKRGVYKKSSHTIFKSKTQVRYSIVNLIDKIKITGTIKNFCPSIPLKLKPQYIGARIKYIIYSYHLNVHGNFDNTIRILDLISRNTNYISMHNIKLKTDKKEYNLKIDLRFYQQASKHNNLDKTFVYEQVRTDKICE